MTDRSLSFRLLAAVAIKLLLIVGLWVFFVKDNVLRVDTTLMASHIE